MISAALDMLMSAMVAAATGAAPPEFAHSAAGAVHGAASAGAPGVDRASDLACYAMLIPFLPALAAVLCGVCAAFRVKTRLPALITVLCLAASFGATVWLFRALGPETTRVVHGFDWLVFSWGADTGQSITANFSLHLDSLTWLWMLFVTGLATLIALYASEYMSHDVGQGYNRFFAYFNLFVLSMACLVMADNLLLLYLGWEGVGLCSYLLIGYFYAKPSAVAASKKAFIMNRIGDLGLALGVFSTFVLFGTVEYATLFESLRAGTTGGGTAIPHWAAFWIPLFFTLGAFGKSAQAFLYVWLPDAMEGPTPVSALIHAATMVTAGVYLIARLYPLYTIDEQRTVLTIVAWSGAITALWSATIGMAQFDIKRIMAYSTVSQLGYMFAGLGVMTTVGGAFHVFTHAFFKATLFLCCGAVMHGFAGQLDLRKLSGVQKLHGWKIVGFAMLVGCLNLAGFPFTAGFFSKDMILAQAFSTPPSAGHGAWIAGANWVGWILLLTAGLTAYYTFRVYFRVFMGPVEFHPGDELHAHDAHDDHGHGGSESRPTTGWHPHAPGWAVNTVLLLLAGLSLAAAATYFIDKSHHGWVGGLVHHSTAAAEAPHGATFLGRDPHVVMYYVSAAVGATGIFFAWALHLAGRTTAERSAADSLVPLLGPIATAARRKWYVDEIYDWLIVKPLWILSHLFHLLDKLGVDGLVNFVGYAPKWLAKGLRPSQNGLLHTYAAGMAGGVAFVLFVVWAMS